MDVKIKVHQEIVNGVLGAKKYDLSVDIKYGTGDFHWSKDCYLHDLDEETVKELVACLTKELENALKI